MEQPLEQKSDLNIVLLGKTGAGKSASGNTILGGDKNTFKEELSPVNVTTCCNSAHTEVRIQRITVIDTVGLPATDFQTEIEDIFQCACDGVDVFLLVIKVVNRFTSEEQKALKWIQENFGAEASKHTIVLFTHKDQLNISIEEYMNKSMLLKSLVSGQCSGRYHVFNNREKNQDQVTELLKKIESLTMINQNRRYTKQDYEKAQKELLKTQCVTVAAIGGAVGAVVGAVGGAIAAKIGAVSLTAVKSVLVGATGGAVTAVMVYMLKFYLSKFVRRNKDKNCM